jgi:hypothetical protein
MHHAKESTLSSIPPVSPAGSTFAAGQSQVSAHPAPAQTQPASDPDHDGDRDMPGRIDVKA